MIAVLGSWELVTNPAKPSGYDAIQKRSFAVPDPAVNQEDPELQQLVGDFIARQVLEKDSIIFEG